MPLGAAIAGHALNWAWPLLASVPVQELLRLLADRSTGPSEEERRTGRSRFWARCAIWRESAGRPGWRPPMAIA